jgi:hypothetical protein
MKYHSGDQIKKNERGGACSTQHAARRKGREEMDTWFWLGNLRERDHLEDPGVDVKTILKWMLRKWDGDCIDLAQDRDGWRALVGEV